MLSEARKAAILARVAPVPIVESLGMRIAAMDEGYCRLIVPFARHLTGLYGAYHGGLLATAADSAAYFAIATITGPDEHMTTSDLAIRYLAPCMTDVRVEARVVKIGRTLCPVRLELYDDGGVLVATSQVTYFRLARPPAVNPPA